VDKLMITHFFKELLTLSEWALGATEEGEG
jgi:hypothetical protein